MLSLPLLLSPYFGGAIETGTEVVPIHPTSHFDEALGYFCTTPKDTCNDACESVGRCTYDLASNHWDWGYQF
ncbi:MAG TPA: hypothetical protein VM580_06715 [Labilithrix sp.]|nr:hypothetical protein [Labilithrix sp.]